MIPIPHAKENEYNVPKYYMGRSTALMGLTRELSNGHAIFFSLFFLWAQAKSGEKTGREKRRRSPNPGRH
jgi:hypothetical protein